MDKDSPDWYLARSLGQIVHNNPDLQNKALLDRFPKSFPTPMDEMLWLPSIKWMLTHETPLPEVRAPKSGTPDKLAELRERSVALYLAQLTNTKIDARLRNTALALAADPRVNTHPRLRPVLEKVRPAYAEPDIPEVQALSPEWKTNFDYFRMWFAPELSRTNREDEFACLGCHGVSGRVPSMGLSPADDNGYLTSRALYTNFRTLMERVNEADVENSKLLRKPLNVQSGKEDGHQGGRRFSPTDRGYEILRRWVLDTAALKRTQPLK